MPERLNRRSKDIRGYPIPAGVLITKEGIPDFKVTDLGKWIFLIKHDRCGLCEESLGRHRAFIGGPASYESRLFTDLPMHKDCAQWAVQVCPYLAAPKFRYAETLKEHEGYAVHKSDLVVPVRPEKFFVAVTKGYRVIPAPDGTTVLKAAPWESSEWWREGVRVEERA
jgi:hypothetical protein